jgi:hypothetical protein
MPGVHRVVPLPSIARPGGLLVAETDALAVHPVRGSATGVVPPELLPLPELPPLLDEPLEEAATSAEASIPDEPPLEELPLEEVPPSVPASESKPPPDAVPPLDDEDVFIMPDDVLLAEEPPLLPLDDEPTPLDPEPFPPPPLDEPPPPSSPA